MDTEVAMINNILSMKDPTTPAKITGIGARLKSAREAMHLSEKEAAARLYLNVKIINIIESESFNEGPPATFMRGYLHSYARLLNFPDSEIYAALKELEANLPVNRDTTHVLRARPIDHTDRYLRWITLSIVSVLVLLVLIWWSSHSKYDIADVPTKSTPEPVPQLKTMVETPTEVSNPIKPTITNEPLTPVKFPLKPTSSNATVGPIIPLATDSQPQSAASDHKKTHKTKKHRYRSSKPKNIVMSLPEPGG